MTGIYRGEKSTQVFDSLDAARMAIPASAAASIEVWEFDQTIEFVRDPNGNDLTMYDGSRWRREVTSAEAVAAVAVATAAAAEASEQADASVSAASEARQAADNANAAAEAAAGAVAGETEARIAADTALTNELDLRATKIELSQTLSTVVGSLAKGRPRVRGGTPIAFGDDGSVVALAQKDRGIDLELTDDSAGLLGLVRPFPGRQPMRGAGLGAILKDEEGGVWAQMNNGHFDAILSDDANLNSGLYTEKGAGRQPLRYRPFLVGAMPDGRLGIFAAWTADGSLLGPWPDGGTPISPDGTSNHYEVEGQYQGYMDAGVPTRSGSVGKWHMNTTAIPGIIGYGQSWMVTNNGGGSGALPEFRTAPLPEFVMTLSDGRGVTGWNGANPTASISGMTDAREQLTQYQSVVGPMAWRYSYLQQRAGGDATVFVRTEARAGYSLARLAPPDFSWYDATITDRPYLNFLRAVQGFKDAADALGQPFELAVIPFIQGQADKNTDYATYKARLVELADRMIADAMIITGQRRRPQFLIVQCPSDDTNGQWQLLNAQVDLCHERADFTLCGAGWAVGQIDGTHFASADTPVVGEMFEIGMQAYMSGLPYSAPYLNDAAISRNGATITCRVLGDYRVRNETGIVTKRHYLSDLSAPVPHFGFEYSGAGIVSAVLDSDGRTITLTLDADAPGRLWYAGHATRRGATGVTANESVNRGTLIADVEIPAVYSAERLTLGLASYYKDL